MYSIAFKKAKQMVRNKKIFLLFLSVGLGSTIVNFSVFGFLWNYVKISYQYAVSISYFLSVLFHFTANRNITFKGNDDIIVTLLIKYIVMVFATYLITLSIMHTVVEFLLLSPYAGLCLSIPVGTIFTYFLAKWWVFPI